MSPYCPQDQVEAAIWYRKAADQGNAGAQDNLGLAYEIGQGVDQDYSQAAIWYHKAADQGLSFAETHLAQLYNDGHGVPRDYVQAAAWYRKAAEQGDIEAQVQLGILYQTGLTENNDVSHSQAIFDISKVKESDYTQAIYWFRSAAEKGDAGAEMLLGDMYDDGKGVPKDFNEAVFWHRKAAEQGHANAQFSLGFAYFNGQGVPQDYAEAYFWLDLAAMGNAASFMQADIEEMRDDAAANLTKAVLLQTQERARQWFEAHQTTNAK